MFARLARLVYFVGKDLRASASSLPNYGSPGGDSGNPTVAAWASEPPTSPSQANTAEQARPPHQGASAIRSRHAENTLYLSAAHFGLIH